MTTAAFLLVLASASAHATWNLLLKQSSHKTAFFWGFSAISFAVFLVPAIVVTVLEGLTPAGVGFAAGSALLHGGYGLSLSRSYEMGDLSASYPLARGMAVALIPIAAVAFLDETISLAAGAGIGLVVAGIYVIQVEARTLGDFTRPLRALGTPGSRVALLTGGFIAAYSIWDKAALDHLEPLMLVEVNHIGYVLIIAPLALRARATPFRQEWDERRWAVVAAGVLAPLAYVLILTALTTNRVSYVGPAREIAIVLGAILGVLVLREGLGPSRVAGAVLIVAGALTLGLAP